VALCAVGVGPESSSQDRAATTALAAQTQVIAAAAALAADYVVNVVTAVGAVNAGAVDAAATVRTYLVVVVTVIVFAQAQGYKWTTLLEIFMASAFCFWNILLFVVLTSRVTRDQSVSHPSNHIWFISL
jgi:hypothetical protein